MDENVEYEVRVLGQTGTRRSPATAEMSVEVIAPATVLSAVFDQAGVHDVVARVQALGLELVDVRRTRHPA